ncbi:MAG: acyl-CoA dehydrogenase [Gammaproteobacteria bacterium]|jgi:acyl-CoA dehydrogenase
MKTFIEFDAVELPDHLQVTRTNVREFLQREFVANRSKFADRFNPEFSRLCGKAGYIGMTWPKQYGGAEKTFLERYVVLEEMLAAGAPVWAHWVADRQSGPMLLDYASEEIKQNLIPKIVAGECYFCIGFSEPDSGSDLFAAKASAKLSSEGWVLNGTKLWTSGARESDYMIALMRTDKPTKDNRRHGLTQFLVSMDTPGISVRPVKSLTGAAEFNEVHFDNVIIPSDNALGEVNDAWKQASKELAYERSGSERFLEIFSVLQELANYVHKNPKVHLQEALGRLVADLYSLRQMSLSVAMMLERGKTPMVEAALVKDVATLWQQALPEQVRNIVGGESDFGDEHQLRCEIDKMLKIAPKLTIQGGTTEILRGIIARGIGLR